MKPKSLLVEIVLLFLLATEANGTVIIDFDDLPAGTIVNTIEAGDLEVTFTSNTGLDLIVSTGKETTSPPNYLGVNDGASELFQGFFGDEVTLEFSIPILSLSANFISTAGTPGEVFSIETSAGSSRSGLNPDRILPSGDEVFRVNFSSPIPFDLATLASDDLNGAAVYAFNIDDIAIPEPSSLALLLLGSIPLAVYSQMRRSS